LLIDDDAGDGGGARLSECGRGNERNAQCGEKREQP
jgi:hypothetical protein